MFTSPLQAYIEDAFTSTAELRSSPRQMRSKQSLTAILATTAEIIDEGGYAAVTTAEVAKRTGLAIGTVYRFFPDRIALMFGVYDDVLRAFLDRAVLNLERTRPEGWADALRTIIDSAAQSRREVAGFQSVHHRILGETGDSERYRERVSGLGAAIAATLAEYGLPVVEGVEGHVTVAVELALSLQRLAFETNPEGDERLTAEARELPVRYLSEHVLEGNS